MHCLGKMTGNWSAYSEFVLQGIAQRDILHGELAKEFKVSPEAWQGCVLSPMIFNYLADCMWRWLVIRKEKAKFGDFIRMLTAFFWLCCWPWVWSDTQNFYRNHCFVKKTEIILKYGAKGFMVNDQKDFFHVLKIVGLRKAGGKSQVSGFLSNWYLILCNFLGFLSALCWYNSTNFLCHFKGMNCPSLRRY